MAATERCILTAFLQSTTKLCVDEGFSLSQADNKSLIGYEFLDKLRAGSLGLAVITTLAGAERVKLLPRKVDQGAGRKIRQKVSNKRDRTFIQVTYNSADKTLASHDYYDMPVTI